jgi:hypothetical protein
MGFYALCNGKVFADVSTKRNAIFFIVKQSLKFTTIRFFETSVFFQMTRRSTQKNSNVYICRRFCLVFCLWLEKGKLQMEEWVRESSVGGGRLLMF